MNITEKLIQLRKSKAYLRKNWQRNLMYLVRPYLVGRPELHYRMQIIFLP